MTGGLVGLGAGVGICSFFLWSAAAGPILSFSSVFSKSWKGSGKSNGVGSSCPSLLLLVAAAVALSFGLGGMEGLCRGGAGLGGWLLRDRDGDCELGGAEAVGSSRSPSEEDEEAKPCCSPSLSSMVSMSSVTASRWLPPLLSIWSLQYSSNKRIVKHTAYHTPHIPNISVLQLLLQLIHWGALKKIGEPGYIQDYVYHNTGFTKISRFLVG